MVARNTRRHLDRVHPEVEPDPAEADLEPYDHGSAQYRLRAEAVAAFVAGDGLHLSVFFFIAQTYKQNREDTNHTAPLMGASARSHALTQ